MMSGVGVEGDSLSRLMASFCVQGGVSSVTVLQLLVHLARVPCV